MRVGFLLRGWGVAFSSNETKNLTYHYISEHTNSLKGVKINSWYLNLKFSENVDKSSNMLHLNGVIVL